MEKVYQLIEKYVKLVYIVKVLNKQNSKSDVFFSDFSNIDFSQLGLSEDVLESIGPYPDANHLKDLIPIFEELSDRTSIEIYGPLATLSFEEKLQVKDYLEDKVSSCLSAVGGYQDTYLSLVVRIDEACKGESKENVRSLGKLAKTVYNKIFEYTLYSQAYSNLVSYFKGLLGSPLKYK